mmetsp:Transcript_6471/g.14938  ORF Transcript_6471/g.14938 Transcript_6471/m.14938 type:complete len:219 (+) Transcript_6471:162-818(+)
MLDHESVLVGAAQTRRVGDRGRQGDPGLLWERLQQRCQEQTGRNGVHADAKLGEVTSDRQGHANDRPLRGRVSDLAHLAVHGRDRGCVDDDTPLVLRVHFPGCHTLGRETHDIEGSDQVHINHLAEQVKGVGALLWVVDLLCDPNARTVHSDIERAPLFLCNVQGLGDIVSVRHIRGAEVRTLTHFLGNIGTIAGWQVAQDHTSSLGDNASSGCAAEA